MFLRPLSVSAVMHLFHGHASTGEQSYRLGTEECSIRKILLTSSQFCLPLFLVESMHPNHHFFVVVDVVYFVSICLIWRILLEVKKPTQ